MAGRFGMENRMKAETCLNLCEIGGYEGIYPVIAEAKEKMTFERIYIGSYFCDEYFLNCDYDALMRLIDRVNNKNQITLVIPVFCEKNLEKGKDFINELLQSYRDEIDEVTVNDYGMMQYMYKNYHCRTNLGRLCFKDYRDPRYLEYFENTWKPKGFTPLLKEWIETYKINSVELDITHRAVDLSENPGCIIGLHTPYTYMTTGKICEYASMRRPVQKKFRPNISCAMECMNACIQYDLEDERKWIRIGRTIYFENNCIKLSNAGEGMANTEARILYFPVNEILAKGVSKNDGDISTLE